LFLLKKNIEPTLNLLKIDYDGILLHYFPVITVSGFETLL